MITALDCIKIITDEISDLRKLGEKWDDPVALASIRQGVSSLETARRRIENAIETDRRAESDRAWREFKRNYEQ